MSLYRVVVIVRLSKRGVPIGEMRRTGPTVKKEISPVILIGAVVAVMAILGFVAYRTFFTDPNYTPIQGAAAEKAYDDARAKDREIYRKALQKGGGGTNP